MQCVVLAQLTLDREIPAHRVGATELIAGGLHRIRCRNVDDAVAQIRDDSLGYAVFNASNGSEAVGRIAVEDEQHRIVGAQGADEIERIPIHAEAGADDGLVIRSVGDAEAWCKQRIRILGAAIHRHDTNTANQHFVVHEVVAFHTATQTAGHRDVLIARADVQGQLLVHLPRVLNVGAVESGAGGVFIVHLIRGAVIIRQSQQERRPRIEGRSCCAGVRLRGATGEVEAALGTVILAREFSLFVVQVLQVDIDAVADLMRTLGPVEIGHVLGLGITAFIGHK